MTELSITPHPSLARSCSPSASATAERERPGAPELRAERRSILSAAMPRITRKDK